MLVALVLILSCSTLSALVCYSALVIASRCDSDVPGVRKGIAQYGHPED